MHWGCRLGAQNHRHCARPRAAREQQPSRGRWPPARGHAGPRSRRPSTARAGHGGLQPPPDAGLPAAAGYNRLEAACRGSGRVGARARLPMLSGLRADRSARPGADHRRHRTACSGPCVHPWGRARRPVAASAHVVWPHMEARNPIEIGKNGLTTGKGKNCACYLNRNHHIFFLSMWRTTTVLR